MPNHQNEEHKRKFILPFATPSAKRLKEFTKNMEMAAILCLAESHREKGESKLLRKTDEKIVFLTEAYYPIWLIPYNRATLVFDGLNATSHMLHYDVTPDIEIFNNDLKRANTTTEAHTAALTRNIDYFRNFKTEEKMQIEGLITNPDLQKDFENYFPNMQELKRQSATSLVLTPTIESRQIQTSIKQLSNHKERINKDIEKLDDCMKILNTTTTHRVRAIQEKIRKTQEEYHAQIKKARRRSNKKIQHLQSQYNRRITIASKKFKGSLLRLKKNQAKQKKTLRHLRAEAKPCETRLQSTKRNSRKQTKVQCSLRLKRGKMKIKTLQKEIEANNKRIRYVENAQRHELAKQRTEYLARIESATQTLRNLQGSREAEIALKRQEIATLDEVTRYITKSMQEMIQKKRATRAQCNLTAMEHVELAWRLVYIPFYLARYEKGERKRYALYPPSTVGDMGILTNLKGALIGARVRALLEPRSEALAKFLNQLPELLENKPLLEKTLAERGIQNSILLRKQLRIGVRKGLAELQNENWISRQELQTIGRILYVYSSLSQPEETVLTLELTSQSA